MSLEDEVLFHLEVSERVEAGLGTAADFEYLNVRYKKYKENAKNSNFQYELWLMENGTACLKCWDNDDFEPSEIELGLLQLFASAYAVSDIENGGLIQFFENSTGCLAAEAVCGFKSMDALPAAEVVNKAMQIFDVNYPRIRQIRIERLHDRSFDSLLEQLTNEFYIANQNFPFKAEHFYRQLVHLREQK